MLRKLLALLLTGSLAAAAALFAAEPFPTPYNSERETNSNPLTAAASARQIQLPPDFRATVFAAEPDVQNPIACAWDSRGRLWVAENYTYAERPLKFDLKLRDRILIFEDTKGDGQFSSRKVFTDDLQMLTSVEVGHGGVWIMCPPRLLFIPDRNGDDVPDALPEVVLDGFTPPPENYHNYANGLRIGPDGWLYGRCGASSPGEIGRPGTAPSDRLPLRGTMWRYHPRLKIVEVLSGGTTNPWGHDWDQHGELFFINTVNGHLWHQIPGAHYVRPHTIDPNPRAYVLIDQHADHWHFDTGQGWAQQRNGVADALGGGHAHVGMMIYQGDNWPEPYRGGLFTLNFHGRRANHEILERRGTGYVGRHAPDFFTAADRWFRGMELTYGPDGRVFVLDWSDTGECHESTGVHRTSGRIYKITHGDPKRPELPNLAKLDAPGLVKLLAHPNQWFARQARLELGKRAEAGDDVTAALAPLHEMFRRESDVALRLRALWTLHAIGAADATFLRLQLRQPNEHLRAWALRLLTDRWPIDTVMSQRPAGAPATVDAALVKIFVNLATSDSSGLVRLVLAYTLQRLPVGQRAELAGALVSRAEDAADHNQPQMVWYGLIPVAESNPTALAPIARRCHLPLTLRCITRRLAEDVEKNPAPINAVLGSAISQPEWFQTEVLAGLGEALAGWRKASPPSSWAALAQKLTASANANLRGRARELSVVFGDGRALEELRKVALDKTAELSTRQTALQSIIDTRAPDARSLCETLLGVRFLNPIAARGLAAHEDPKVGEQLVKAWPHFHPSERPQLLAVLISRPMFARALLDAIAQDTIPRAEVSPSQARRIRQFNNIALTRRLTEVWGDLRDTPGDKQRFMAKLRMELTPAARATADPAAGRVVFQATCAVCHRLHGQGAEIGPDLTGANRDNLDYLLENAVDPSAVVTADFRVTEFTLHDGRVFIGVIKAETERIVTVQTPTELLRLERTEIAERKPSALSLMPEGLLESLTPAQVLDLVAYLMSP